ncbi:hypothetical protein ACXYUI_28045, partial [Klebsiella pneumoniae]
PGEVKTVLVKLPDSYADTALAGQELTFTITVNDLKLLDIPELDDEFAKDLNHYDAASLKTQIRSQLEERAKEMTRQRLEAALLSKILDANP